MYVLDQLDLNDREEVERMVTVFPEIRTELESIQSALEMYAQSQGMTPHPRVKQKIQDSISNIEKEKEMSLEALPLITPYSDHSKWLELVKNMIPEQIAKEETFTEILHQSEKVVQMLVVTSADIADETHEESHESFLILKGRCKCTVGTDVRYMAEGDFMAIPLYEHHNVEILSEKVVAILQHVALC
jgi:mannose-6-phosphate isomerase-like protein (cupin superfamily)